MAAKPAWLGRLHQIVGDLEALPSPWVTRGTVEFLLGVGPRRAQQIMQPCVIEQVGSSLVADRRLLIDRLQSLASGNAGHFEARRRQKLAHALQQLHSQWLARPKVLVEAPVAITGQRLGDLPSGIELAPGQITVRFQDSSEALRKLLALAMAIGNDPDRFRELITPRANAKTAY